MTATRSIGLDAGVHDDAAGLREETTSLRPKLAAADPGGCRMLGGKYRVGRLLGRGGAASVYEVETSDGHIAAAKVLALTGTDSVAVERLLREAMAAQSIDSPHVTKVLGVGRDDGSGNPFIVMERLHGIDLAKLYAERAPLTPTPLIRIFAQAGLGVSAAHRLGIAHRDIKPANLFLDLGDGTHVTVKLCDFGLAKLYRRDDAASDLTQAGSMLGSPYYMSPEQAINAKRVDHRSDIWSFGIALYEGLSGRRVWKNCSSLGDIIIAICTKRVPPLRSVAPWIDPDLATVVDRAVEPDPATRWPSMDDLLAALEPFTKGSTDVRLDDLVRIPRDIQNGASATRDPAATCLKTAAPARRSSKGLNRSGTLFIVAAPLFIAAGAVLAFTAVNQPGSTRGSGSAVVVSNAALPQRLLTASSVGAAVSKDHPPQSLLPPPANSTLSPTTRPRSTVGNGSGRMVRQAGARVVPISPTPLSSRPSSAPLPVSMRPCRAPYYVDSAGIRHIKDECL